MDLAVRFFTFAWWLLLATYIIVGMLSFSFSLFFILAISSLISFLSNFGLLLLLVGWFVVIYGPEEVLFKRVYGWMGKL